MTALTHSEAVKTGVSVGMQLADDSPLIQGDRVQLQQVMLNLIVNAIQSTSGVEDGKRELHISTVRIEPEGVCVAVPDTGPGLRPESLPRLFEPFYTTKPDGMGMGLSICGSIIEAYGGRLWATSYEPRGALFQFTIPLSEPPPVIDVAYWRRAAPTCATARPQSAKADTAFQAHPLVNRMNLA